MNNDFCLRWMLRRDDAEVHAIENASFLNPWSPEDFLIFLRSHNSIGMVAERVVSSRPLVVGFVLYSLQKTHISIGNFAVHPAHRRTGVGTAMIDRIRWKLSPQRRQSVKLMLRESNLGAQLFLRSLGFRCNESFHGFYDDTDEDGLFFEWFCTEESCERITS